MHSKLYSKLFIGIRSFSQKTGCDVTVIGGGTVLPTRFIALLMTMIVTGLITGNTYAQETSEQLENGLINDLPDDLKPVVNPSYLSTNKQGKLTNTLMEKAYQNYDSSEDTDTTDNVPRCSGYWLYPSQKTDASNTDNGSSISSDVDATVAQGGLQALADYGYYDNKNYAELVGNVTVRQAEQVINAEKVILDLANNTATAQGEVMFTDGTVDGDNVGTDIQGTDFKNNMGSGGFVGIADNIHYDTTSKTANAHDIAFASIPMQANGYAKSLSKNSESQYNLKNVVFSTCQPQDRKWHIDAKSIDLDTETGRGESYNTTLKIKNVPVMYLPYFNFPIDDRRASGFLTPSSSYHSLNDFEVEVPYYLNLAPNYDATLNTRIFTDRNPMATADVRYLTERYGSGRMVGSYLPSDKKFDDNNRSSFFYEHEWQSKSMPSVTTDLQYNYLSDSSYTDDFEYSGDANNELNLARLAKVNYTTDTLDAELKVESYQPLEATDLYGNRIEDKDRPYDRLPQLSVNYFSPSLADTLADVGIVKSDNTTSKASTDKLNNIHVTAEHDSAYFKKSIEDGSSLEKSGFRMFNKLSASYPYRRPWGHITPHFNLQHIYTTYDEDTRIANNIGTHEKSQSVFVPQISLDAQANFIKKGSPSSRLTSQFDKTEGYQMLSPRIKYSYAPFKNQNTIPNFNTHVATISYEQLYADSWFLGHDRLQDLHAITPSVNYRYIDAIGQTRLDASIAQQYYLDRGQVTLNDSSATNSNRNNLFNDDSSGLVTSLSVQPYHNFWVDVNGAFTNDYDINYITSQMRYQPSADSQLSIGVIERKKDSNTNQLPISALTSSAIFPINNNWRVMTQTQYDYDRNKFLDTTLGLDYEDCCFGFAIYGRRYYNELNLSENPNDVYMAEIRLNGLSDKNSRLRKLISQKVIGIDTVNESWKRHD